jgi:opacity protein-like surface antigen
MKYYGYTIAIALGSLFSSAAYAQGLFGVRPRPVHNFEDTQWYVGFVSGATYAHPTVTQAFSELVSISGPDKVKSYPVEELSLGFSGGVAATAALTPSLQLAASARYTTLKYSYQYSYHWIDEENPNNQLTAEHNHHHTLGYVEFPLSVRYGIPLQRFKPFAQASLIYGRLIQARKALIASTIDYASGAATSALTVTQMTDITSLYNKSYLGYTLGGGIAYNFGGVVVVVDAEYRRGFNTIVNAENRYPAARDLAGLGNVSDDIRLNAIGGTVSFFFPLKFLTDKSFKPVIF